MTPLKDSFEHWNPKIVASWASTGLATALNYNSIPLSLESEDADNFIWNVMMYPMQHKVLFWPNDMSFLEMALQSEVSFKMQLTRLCNYQDSLLTSVVH